MRRLSAAVALAVLSTSLLAQEVAPILATPMVRPGTVLPQNTPVVLTLNNTLNTKSKTTRVGESFTMSVARNVVMDGHVVIPRGARGIGHVSYRTKKGAFGKSGKMEVELDYIEIGDQRIPITGNERVEGEGNSTATIATAAFLSIIGAGLITGRSAEIPRGREMTAWTKEDVPVIFPSDAQTASQMPTAVNGAIEVAPTAVTRAAAQAALKPQRKVLNRRVSCDTCRD